MNHDQGEKITNINVFIRILSDHSQVFFWSFTNTIYPLKRFINYIVVSAANNSQLAGGTRDTRVDDPRIKSQVGREIGNQGRIRQLPAM